MVVDKHSLGKMMLQSASALLLLPPYPVDQCFRAASRSGKDTACTGLSRIAWNLALSDSEMEQILNPTGLVFNIE